MVTTTYIPSVGHPRDTPPVAALTTIFTPPASCLNTLFVEYYTQDQPPNNLGNTHLTLGLMPMSQCFPVSYREDYWHSEVGYYSPAVCPSGYTSACDVLHVSTNGFLWGPSLLPSETAYKCCPFGYSCDLNTANSDVCWSILSTTTTAVSHDYIDDSSPPLLGPTMTVNSLPVYVQAFAIQVRFQPSDLATLPPSITPGAAVASPTPSVTQTSLENSRSSSSAAVTSTSILSNDTLSHAASGVPTYEKIAISASTIGAVLLILILGFIFFLRRRRAKRITDIHGVRPIKLSWWSTLDKLLLSTNLILGALGILGILNGRCSRPRRLTAEAPVCVGGNLSIQTWLAITGVEFSLLGAFLLPRLTKVFISKLVTGRLTGGGTKLATLLNSQGTAPFSTQLLSGSAGIFICRMFIILVGIAISILYKFSYTQVNINGSAAAVGSSWIDFTTRSYGHSPFENGLIDSITGNPLGTRDFQNGSQYDPYTFLVGPELNTSSVPQLLNGTAYTCYPVNYIKSTITASSIEAEDFIINVTQPFNDGVRILSSQTNPDINAIVDVYTDNHTMIAIAGYYHSSSSTTQEKYTTVYTIAQQACAGYLSWNNSAGYQDYSIEFPTDVSCLLQAFDVGQWRTTLIGKFALATINASIFSEFKNFTNTDKLWELTRNTILPTTEITYPQLQDSDWPSVQHSPVHPACARFYDDPAFKLVPTGISFNGVREMMPANDSKFWDGQIVMVGLIQNAGTGMTGLGLGLQVLVVVVCLLSILVQIWRPLPLLSEWPGQWLVLASRLDRSTIYGNREGPSVGKGSVNSETVVWLASSNLDAERRNDPKSGRGESQGLAGLVLKEEKSPILWSLGHI